MTDRPFKKILVANRGEIAVRIIRAAHEMGIPAAVVYSSADRTSRAVRLGDDAVCIGPPEARLSYLDAGKIIEAAKSVGADAIHPGYGFLAENADFARQVVEAGITFIGPRADAIDAMGDKINSRQRMMAAGVPVIPGIERETFSRDELETAAEEVGYPVMLKATAGGGGKGIRVVREVSELWNAYERSVGEATKFFGNGTIYIEKFVSEPHHIEFQVFGDSHGNAIHLFERECSIQRRHQKVVEETPSPFMTPELREEMGAAAVAAAKAIDYDNAGTVEFLVDGDRKFYFLEMNTRLQVEHPITESVLGVDLVKEQFRVAAGAPLSMKQEDLVVRGHAVEARICAEDPDNGYLPSTGVIEALTLPSGTGVRIDSALDVGLEVSLHYDPMLAKLITWGSDRTDALMRMKQALSELKIAGVKTNIPLLGAILRDEAFLGGTYDTSYLDDFSRPPMHDVHLRAAIIGAVVMRETNGGVQRVGENGIAKSSSKWKTNARLRGVSRR